MKKFNWVTLIGFIIGVEIVGGIGTIATSPNIATWYAALEKPVFNPPNWLFGPVWTILFALMGIAAYLVYRNGTKKQKVRQALTIFGIQLVLNVAWSFIFFGAHQLLFGLIEIILMWLAIAATIVAFKPISKLAAWLLVPYLLWVSFATILNAAVYLLNK